MSNLDSLLQQKEDILGRFDFDKVHEYMKETNWTWFAHGVPTPFELKVTAARLLDRVIQSPEPASNSGTGGLTAYKLPWGLSLHFSVESETSY
jgi:hypothetical protein